jgi:hypothetical protein
MDSFSKEGKSTYKNIPKILQVAEDVLESHRTLVTAIHRTGAATNPLGQTHAHHSTHKTRPAGVQALNLKVNLCVIIL